VFDDAQRKEAIERIPTKRQSANIPDNELHIGIGSSNIAQGFKGKINSHDESTAMVLEKLDDAATSAPRFQDDILLAGIGEKWSIVFFPSKNCMIPPNSGLLPPLGPELGVVGGMG